MKTNAALLLIFFFAGGWEMMAQDATTKPLVPTVPLNPPKEELKAPDLSKPKEDRLRSLIEELTKKMKPAANAMPGRTKDGFIEDQELILRLATEVLLLRERVEKLEHK